MRADRVIIAVEGGGPTGGAERVAFDTVKVLSDEGIPVTIISSSAAIDPFYLALPGVQGLALDLPYHFNRFFEGGKKVMVRNLLEDRTMKALFARVLGELDSPKTVYHAHGFHNYFTQASLHVAVGLQMKTILSCHDYGIACPNSMQYDYVKGEICPLDPLSGACRKSACMGEDALRLKQLRFARAWAAERLYRVPQKMDKILAVSEFERGILQKHFGSKAQIGVLCNPVTPASNTCQNPVESAEFLWVGRMTAEKDPVSPAIACAALEVPFTVVGDGPLQTQVAAEYPATNFLGWLGAEEVQKRQRGARALIMSSRCYETASLVVPECLAAGIPCIVPSTSAATSWVEHGVNGHYFEIGNMSSLTTAVWSFGDGAYVEELGRNAFERYWKNPYSIERYRTELLNHYSEVLA